STLGVQPLMGRSFSAGEDRPGGASVAMISYGLWQSRFGGQHDALGKTILIDGRVWRIVGILPAAFEFPSLAQGDVFTPEALNENVQHPETGSFLRAIARLKPGVTVEQAARQMQPLFQNSLRWVPAGFRKEVSLRVRPLRDLQIHGARMASWVLFGAVLSVLLIACANVANLLLARAASRQRELAVRIALGAARFRVIRQALTESLLLGALGGIAGCALGYPLLRIFAAIAPAGIPRLAEASLDSRVLLFCFLASLACGLLFGLAPALQNPAAETLGGWKSVGVRRSLFRHTLAAAQLAVSLVLLTGAGLLLRSLWNLENAPLGMDSSHVVTAPVLLGGRRYGQPAQQAAFYNELQQRLEKIPGAVVAISDTLPPHGGVRSTIYAAIDVEGRPRSQEGTGGMVPWRSVTPEYFRALHIPILRGRGFEETDRAGEATAVILSRKMERRMFPDGDALGKQIRPGRTGPWRTIVGIAGDVKNNGLNAPSDPEYYVIRPRLPSEDWPASSVIVRSPEDRTP
ncbi:MAG: ABC transporter permease, partial [Bryobacteraceae bacterium]